MILELKLLCLINNEVKPGDRWLWKDLPSNNEGSIL